LCGGDGDVSIAENDVKRERGAKPQGFVERFLFIYLIDELGASTLLCGGTVLLTVLFEIPIFHYYDKIERTIGRGGVLTVAYICYVIRVFGCVSTLPLWVPHTHCVDHGCTHAPRKVPSWLRSSAKDALNSVIS
jgi:hypothetical protein